MAIETDTSSKNVKCCKYENSVRIAYKIYAHICTFQFKLYSALNNKGTVEHTMEQPVYNELCVAYARRMFVRTIDYAMLPSLHRLLRLICS